MYLYPCICTLCKEGEYIGRVKNPDPSWRWQWLGGWAGLQWGAWIRGSPEPLLTLQIGPCSWVRVRKNAGRNAQVKEVMRGVALCYWNRLKLQRIKGF